jgi:hypothetical protein
MITQDEVLGGLELLNDAEVFTATSPGLAPFDPAKPVKVWKFKPKTTHYVNDEGMVEYSVWGVKGALITLNEKQDLPVEYLNLVNIPPGVKPDGLKFYPIPQRSLKDTEDVAFYLGVPHVVKKGADNDLNDSQMIKATYDMVKELVRNQLY